MLFVCEKKEQSCVNKTDDQKRENSKKLKITEFVTTGVGSTVVARTGGDEYWLLLFEFLPEV